jgi:hypothetical protein
MRQQIPEPYDITDIPYIAWVPGTSAWIAITAALALLAAYVWTRNNPRAPRGDLKIIDKMIAELKAAVDATSGVHLERTSRIARRIVSHLSGQNVAERTGEELRASITEQTPTRLAEIITAVATFEEIGYAPPSPERERSARELGRHLAARIDEYRNELRAR